MPGLGNAPYRVCDPMLRSRAWARCTYTTSVLLVCFLLSPLPQVQVRVGTCARRSSPARAAPWIALTALMCASFRVIACFLLEFAHCPCLANAPRHAVFSHMPTEKIGKWPFVGEIELNMFHMCGRGRVLN